MVKIAALLKSNRLCVKLVASLTFFLLAVCGLVWWFKPLSFATLIDHRGHSANHPVDSVYFGNGCFWHTQFDLVNLEQEHGDFGFREDREVTSLVGYAGGKLQSSSGPVCYHALPPLDYGLLGHAEAVQVFLSSFPLSLSLTPNSRMRP